MIHPFSRAARPPVYRAFLAGWAVLYLSSCGADRLLRTAFVESVEVSPDSATLGVGESLDLSATLRDADGEMLWTRPAWLSLDPIVVSVDSTGRAWAVGIGAGRVQATADGRSDEARIRVVAAVATVAVTPDTLTVEVGESWALGVTLRNRNGAPVANVTPSWKSSEPTLATVDPDGRVHALRAGVSFISASVGAVSDTATIRVLARPSEALGTRPRITSP